MNTNSSDLIVQRQVSSSLKTDIRLKIFLSIQVLKPLIDLLNAPLISANTNFMIC